MHGAKLKKEATENQIRTYLRDNQAEPHSKAASGHSQHRHGGSKTATRGRRKMFQVFVARGESEVGKYESSCKDGVYEPKSRIDG
jgi:hypothetical protein